MRLRVRALAVPLLVAVLVAALAGCSAPEPEEDPLLGLCPAWSAGPAQEFRVEGGAAGNVSLAIEPERLEHQGRPLDLYRVHVANATQEGTVQVRAFAANGTQLTLRDYRQEQAQLVPSLTVAQDGAGLGEFDILLSGLAEGSPAHPGPVRLEWRSAGGDLRGLAWDVTVTEHYRLCGAPV